MLRRQKHVLSQSTTPFACTILFYIERKQKGGFVIKGGFGKCAMVPDFCTVVAFFVPSFRFLVLPFNFWYPCSGFGDPGNIRQNTLLEPFCEPPDYRCSDAGPRKHAVNGQIVLWKSCFSQGHVSGSRTTLNSVSVASKLV